LKALAASLFTMAKNTTGTKIKQQKFPNQFPVIGKSTNILQKE
jgi:hypothetical protein